LVGAIGAAPSAVAGAHRRDVGRLQGRRGTASECPDAEAGYGRGDYHPVEGETAERAPPHPAYGLRRGVGPRTPGQSPHRGGGPVRGGLGAGIVRTTARRAAGARGGATKPVYFLGGGFAKDRQRFMVDKSDFTRSPALVQAAARAEARAGMRVADMECFDLY